MRRAFAILLTMLVSFPLILPAFVSDPSANLPACCRKNGKHGCGMANMAGHSVSDSSQPSIQSVKTKCPFYPSSNSGPVSSIALNHDTAQLFFGEEISRPALQAQTEARYRISFDRACQKRGPPAFLLS